MPYTPIYLPQTWFDDVISHLTMVFSQCEDRHWKALQLLLKITRRSNLAIRTISPHMLMAIDRFSKHDESLSTTARAVCHDRLGWVYNAVALRVKSDLAPRKDKTSKKKLALEYYFLLELVKLFSQVTDEGERNVEPDVNNFTLERKKSSGCNRRLYKSL